MKTYRRATHEVYHTTQQRNCTHPDSSILVQQWGGTKLVNGELYDTTREVMFCRDCGLEVEMVDMVNYIDHEFGFAH
jgi:hypothetical protein